MQKYMFLAIFNTLFFLFAEENPFLLSEHLSQLDKEKDALLKSLVDPNDGSHRMAPHKKHSKNIVPAKSLVETKEKDNQIKRQKRLEKMKKIRQERTKALRIKKHNEALRRQSQERASKKNIESSAVNRKKDLKKQIASAKIENNLFKHKKQVLTKEEALEQAYREAIKEVNQ